ncbi:MAG: cytochrome c3 family protein [Deltaproteobacteria bacterium]|nr:cytochrome c3 family protein [Deltaproteobacteria bacterium]
MIRALLLSLFFLTATLLAITARSADPPGKSPHVMCTTCHFSGEISQGGSDPKGSPAIRPCAQCHIEVSGPPGHTGSNGTGERTVAPLGGETFDRLLCLTCHSSHPQGQPKQLRLDRLVVKVASRGMAFDPATKLCLSCHPITAEVKFGGPGHVRHPIGIPVTKVSWRSGDPQFPPLFDVKGTADLWDDVIGCGTCHSVHATRNPFLLRWEREALSAACLKCHPDVAPSNPGGSRGLVRR